MASGAAVLALKTTAVLAVLAALVLPSLGRCPSQGPETPSPAPGQAPPVLCSECPSRCTLESCSATVAAECGRYCSPPPGCDACRSTELEKCRACCGNGTCSCDCDNSVASKCYGDCYFQYQTCTDCRRGTGQQCTDTCNGNCAATCVNI